MNSDTKSTLEEMILTMWRDCIEYAANYSAIPTEAIQKLISETRKIAADAGWPATYAHEFFVELANILRAQTLGHPTTKQIIRLLEIETEFD